MEFYVSVGHYQYNVNQSMWIDMSQCAYPTEGVKVSANMKMYIVNVPM